MNHKAAWLLVFTLTGCAIEVPRTPSALSQASAQSDHRIIQLDVDTAIDVGTGYPRLLPRGTVLKHVGRIAEGEVYKPVNFTLTLEGANVHEAFLVLKDFDLVGFYLPVEGAFVLPKAKITTKFSTRG